MENEFKYEKDLYNFEHRWKLKDWIDENDLHIFYLCFNPNAMFLIEKYWEAKKRHNITLYKKYDEGYERQTTQLDWHYLSQNPSAMYFLERNKDMIDHWFLPGNPSAIYYVQKNMGNIKNILKGVFNKKYRFNTNLLSENQNPNVIPFLEKNKRLINWSFLSKNPNAVHVLKQNQHKIDWMTFSSNPSDEAILLLKENMQRINWDSLCSNTSEKAINILEQYKYKIVWSVLSSNPSKRAIHLLEQNQDRIYWTGLCANTNPDAIHLIEKNIDKLNFHELAFYHNCVLSKNLSAIDLLQKNKNKIIWTQLSKNPNIFELDYDFFYRRMNIIRKELMEKTWHPERIKDWCLDIDELKEFI